jgi:hypothetical protein
MTNHYQQHRTFLVLTTLMALLAIGGVHPERLADDFIQRPLWLMASLIPLSLFSAWFYLRHLKQSGFNSEREKLNQAIAEEMKRITKEQILRQMDDEYETNVGKGHLAGYVIHNIYNDKKRFQCEGRECKGVVVIDLHAHSGRKQNKRVEEKFTHKFSRQDYHDIRTEVMQDFADIKVHSLEWLAPILYYLIVLPFYIFYLYNY